MSDEVHERLKSANLGAGMVRLQPSDWTSGPHIWLMELCSPNGYIPQLLAEMKQPVFKENPVNMHVLGEWKTL